MDGLKVGHFSDQAQGVGVSVFLFESGAAGAYWVCGAAPASHELAAIDLGSSVTHCHGLMLAGGSAYGLPAVAGVMQYLGERGIGHPVPTGTVPVVPAAAVYDLAYQSAVFPTPEQAYQACLSATEENAQRGRIGAGTGATVGKLIPDAHCMTGGLGRAVLRQSNGLEVIAYVVLNSVGDIYADEGIVAGACDQTGKFLDCESFLLAGRSEVDLFAGANTSLAVIVTNAAFSKEACHRTAKMAAAGMARAISPAFTRFDGDIIFCLSTDKVKASELTVGTMAAEALRLAILDAVKESEIVKG